MKPKCPYCNYLNCIPEVAYTNVEFYGGGSSNICCVKCGGALRVHLTRIVKCIDIDKTNFETSDWGEIPIKTNK